MLDTILESGMQRWMSMSVDLAIEELLVGVGEWLGYSRRVRTEAEPRGGRQPCGWGGLSSP